MQAVCYDASVIHNDEFLPQKAVGFSTMTSTNENQIQLRRELKRTNALFPNHHNFPCPGLLIPLSGFPHHTNSDAPHLWIAGIYESLEPTLEDWPLESSTQELKLMFFPGVRRILPSLPEGVKSATVHPICCKKTRTATDHHSPTHFFVEQVREILYYSC